MGEVHRAEHLLREAVRVERHLGGLGCRAGEDGQRALVMMDSPIATSLRRMFPNGGRAASKQAAAGGDLES